MSTLRTIRGLSGAGFRIKDQTSGYNRKVNENNSYVVDVDDITTQLILYGEKDNFIRTKEKGTFTVTSATPAVFSKTAHGLVAGDIIVLSTTGALYTGLTAGTKYHVIATGLSANSFRVSLTDSGAAVNTSGSQSGTHTLTPVTTDIVGLTRYGIRIKDYLGVLQTVRFNEPGTAAVATKVDLSDGDTRRNLRRSYGRYIVSADINSVTIRGLAGGPKFDNPEMNGFELVGGPGTTEDVLTSNNTNVSAADTVVIETDTYTFVTALTEAKATDTITTSGTPASVRATGTVTTSGTGAANNDTLTIGGVTYTFKTSLTGAANEVLRDGTEDNDLTNLIAAINHTAGEGTTYGTGTVANPTVTAGTITSHVLTLTAKTYKASLGNAIVLTKTGAVFTVSGSGTFASGTNETVTLNGQVYTFVEALDAGVAYEVLINGQDTSLTNLASAINGTSGAGTTYGTGTVASTIVTAGSVVSHAITLTALAIGVAGNAYTLAVSGSHLARGSADFTGGLDSVANEVVVGTDADDSLTNLSEAINGTPNAGIDFSTATEASAFVTASEVGIPAAHKITLTALEAAGGSVAVSTTAATLSFAEGEITSPLVKVYRGVTVTVDPQEPNIYTQLRRFYKKWIEV